MEWSSKKEKVRGSFNLMKMYYLNSDCLKCIPLLEYVLLIWNGIFSIRIPYSVTSTNTSTSANTNYLHLLF